MIVGQTLVNIHRRHLGAQMRDAKRDISIFAGHHQQAASTSLALQLLGQLTSPSEAAMREETARRLEQAVAGMDELDREVLTLRHFEQLTNSEVCEVLGIKAKAASIRYVRALKRLKEKLAQTPEFSDLTKDSSSR
jgi:RNA polymerase sigma-70 factor (ECF subfamily)